MNWRNANVVIILILANYLVFSTMATMFFPPTPVTAPTHVAKPTFTPGPTELKNVGPLSYDFLTPTITSTITPTLTISMTTTVTVTGTVRTVVPTAPATKAP